MDRIFVYLVKMPRGIRESVCPCDDGYTVYLDENLTREQLIKAYDHAVSHIENGDFYDDTRSVSQKEFRAHGL